ncbi:ROK family transcriptional regulator [Actinoallomurus iriomotensis]|uniref:Sugar kinase n=1 Tax=Actinoallomurus iriomotensis TaxID=478107 RepID=A0A9W6VU01_9ACTN|nr:ROK family transcriptional regulator [Actinoallomurus iriomotensis]GLY78186.1 sugar kinase [Actinoallomurus iriomotensis]
MTRRRIRGSTQDDVRRHNLGTILTEVHRHGHRSRALLTAEMGLNRSTIGDLVAELTEAGLVLQRSASAQGRAGRPSLEVVPFPEGVYVLAVDLGVRHLAVARVGLGGDVLDRVDVEPERDWSDLDVTVEAIADTCDRLRRAAPSGARCVGVGLSVPGVVRHEDGLLRFAPNLGWTDVPFGARLGERLDLPAVIANDADLGALAEHWRGAAAGYEHVVVMSGEIGIGGGILVGGRPLRGRGGYAGEIGHLRVNPDGRLCRCGSTGCLETEVGADALLREAGRRPGSGMDAYRDVLAKAAAGERDCVAAAARVANWLGVGVGILVNTFNPDIVILAGPLGELYQATADTVAEAAAQSSLVAPREQVRLAASALGPDAQIVGAAELAFEPLLEDPIGTLSRHAA